MSPIPRLLVVILFPILYLITDMVVRAELLALYSPLQRTFYLLSLIASVAWYFFMLYLLKKIYTRRILYYSVVSLFTFYLVASVVGSYIFFYFNGFFPNFYTYEYFKNEPLSAFILLRDSIKLQDILLFLTGFTFFFTIIHSAVKQVREGSLTRKMGITLLIALPLFVLLVVKIKKYDQCLTVDTNFSAAITRHFFEFNKERKFTGRGLGARSPLALPKVERNEDLNVLVIVFESMRKQDLQVYGYQRKTTPNLAAFRKNHAKNMMIFRHPFAVSTTTMLAVPAVLTGIGPYQEKEIFYSQPFLWNYGEMLDYHTFFLSSHSLKWYRFDRFYNGEKLDHLWYKERSGKPFFNDLGINDKHTIAHLNAVISDEKDRPFFGVVQLNATHYPYNVPDEFKKWKGSFLDEYDNSILYQDYVIGKLLRKLESSGLLKNTVVFFTSDHGESLKDHNNIGHVDSYYIETISVPLMIYLPDQVMQRKDIGNLLKNRNATVSTIDIAPTIVDILGLRHEEALKEIYSRYTGYSLFDKIPHDRAVITMNNNEVARFKVGLSVVRSGWHYLHRMNIVPNREELYHIAVDPREEQNRIGDVAKHFVRSMTDECRVYPACDRFLKKK